MRNKYCANYVKYTLHEKYCLVEGISEYWAAHWAFSFTLSMIALYECKHSTKCEKVAVLIQTALLLLATYREDSSKY